MLFDVMEIEISPPHNKRVMAVDLSEADAEAFIEIAIVRRGVEKYFYKSVPAGSMRNGEVR